MKIDKIDVVAIVAVAAFAVIVSAVIIASKIRNNKHEHNQTLALEYQRGKDDGINWMADKILQDKVVVARNGERLTLNNVSNVELSDLVFIQRPAPWHWGVAAIEFGTNVSHAKIEGCVFNMLGDKVGGFINIK